MSIGIPGGMLENEKEKKLPRASLKKKSGNSMVRHRKIDWILSYGK